MNQKDLTTNSLRKLSLKFNHKSILVISRKRTMFAKCLRRRMSGNIRHGMNIRCNLKLTWPNFGTECLNIDKPHEYKIENPPP